MMVLRDPTARPSFLSTLPVVVRRGFVVVAAGAVVDTAYHVLPRRPGLGAWAGLAGHLITLVGMVIVMVGVLGVALRNRHP
jgi:hypothetical protein